MVVSRIGLGCGNFGTRIDTSATRAVVEAALEAGITFFDTSNSYGRGASESLLGAALGPHRKRVVIATKFGSLASEAGGGARPEHLRSAAEASLRRLGTDWIDLYQMHRPDSDVPIADTLGALDDLVHAGKVRAIGCSNFSADQIAEARAASAAGGIASFAAVQNGLSLINRGAEREVLPACERLGLAFIPHRPLASGLLTGKYRLRAAAPKGARISDMMRAHRREILTENHLAVIERLSAFAQERGHTLLELSLSWLATRPAIASIIAGACTPEQVRANVAATRWTLTGEDLIALDRIADRALAIDGAPSRRPRPSRLSLDRWIDAVVDLHGLIIRSVLNRSPWSRPPRDHAR
jgi:aryl-alcohol dehydrogenase-like predicted oxidoreductase